MAWLTFRKPGKADDVVNTPAPAGAVDLSSAPLSDLVAELRRRGWQAVPDEKLTEIETKGEEIAAAEERGREFWPLVNEISNAARALPEAVREVIALSRENAQLHRQIARLQVRAERLERDFTTVSQALVGEEFPETLYDPDDDPTPS